MITDWNNLCYPYPWSIWTQSYTPQVHIERQDDTNITLCGRDCTGWAGADPEPGEPDRDKCYASCKQCIKVYNRLRSLQPKASENL